MKNLNRSKLAAALLVVLFTFGAVGCVVKPSDWYWDFRLDDGTSVVGITAVPVSRISSPEVALEEIVQVSTIASDLFVMIGGFVALLMYRFNRQRASEADRRREDERFRLLEERLESIESTGRRR